MWKEETKMETKQKQPFISKPLFIQSFKSLKLIFIILTVGAALIFFAINLAIGSKNIFTNIDMNNVSKYVTDEKMSWLQVLGLLETMGFSLARIQAMSQMDLNSILGELIYKISGVLLPMIYVIIASNKLVAAQVTDGSMAYVLSTPTNRKTVVRTQYIFLLLSVTVMYAIITIAAVGSEGISTAIAMRRVDAKVSNWIPLKTVLACVGSFVAMFGITGICFGASCFFNKQNNSIAAGGGICVVSFICCILGLFGNEAFVAVGIGVKTMYFFSFLSIFTLIDTKSMNNFCDALFTDKTDLSAFSFNWIWEIAILLAIGVIFAYIGARRFVKKDLPL